MKRSYFKKKKLTLEEINAQHYKRVNSILKKAGKWKFDKPRKALKRGTLKKKSKQSISKIQRTLWELCKQITRKRYGNKCYTCSASDLAGGNWHTGHLMAKASLGAFLKYDLRVLRPQCYKCNIHHGGAGAEFYRRMMIEVGPTAMNELLLDKQKTVKAYDHYVKLIEKYKQLI